MVNTIFICGDFYEVREDRESFVRNFPRVLVDEPELVNHYGNVTEELRLALRCYRIALRTWLRLEARARVTPLISRVYPPYYDERNYFRCLVAEHRAEVRNCIQLARWEEQLMEEEYVPAARAA